MRRDGDSRNGNGITAGSGRYDRVMAWFVGGPPPESSRRWDRVWVALGVPLLVVASSAGLAQEGEILAMRVYSPLIVLGSILLSMGRLLYRRWPFAADLLRLTGNLGFVSGVVVLMVGHWQSGNRGWFWWNVAVMAAITAVVAGWSLYKRMEQTDGS